MFGLFAAALSSPVAATDRWANLATTVFHNYGRDQGLPHSVPTALAQDRQGFLWIGTQGGLARWDGYRFHTYRADHDVPGSLPEDYIQTLHVDPAGRLWIGTGGGGLALYDNKHDRFVAVPLGPSKGRTHIGAIADDGRRGLWIGRQDGPLHLNPETFAVTSLRTIMPSATWLPQGGVQAIVRDRSGALWIGTNKGLAHRRAGASSFEPVAIGGGDMVTALFEDAAGRIWIGTGQHGLFVIDRPGVPPRSIGAPASALIGQISAICAAAGHEIWAGMRGGGILAVDTRTGKIRIIRHDRTLASSLIHNDIWSLLRDRAGSVWVGSGNGLSYAPTNDGLIATIFSASDRPNGLRGSDILSVLGTRDGHVWVGYLDGGADKIDPDSGRVQALRPGPPHDARTLPPDFVFAIAEGDDGAIYFGTRRGLYAMPPGTASPQLMTITGRNPRASVAALAGDDGLLWVGGEEGGLWAIEPRSGRVAFGPKQAAMLSDPGVRVIRRGPGAFLWVGTRGGLDRIDLATHAVEHVTSGAADPQPRPGRNVVALLFDRQGRLWAGSFGGGLTLITGWSGAHPSFRHFGPAEGLPHVNVDSLQMDGAGVIWAGTDDGLARIDPRTLAIRPVGRADGSFLVDYLAGGGSATPQGEALFGASGGLTVVRPGPLPAWRLQPPIVVTDLRIGERSIPIGPLNAPGAEPSIEIPSASNSLAVEFAALDFTAPERNRYAYRLDGFDTEWIETDAGRRLAIYTNLPPGDYTLRLRGTNRDGAWAMRERVLQVHVLPAWYQRLWFKAALALLLVLGVLALIRWRTVYLRRRQVELEGQIAERTADLRAANERLGLLATTDPLTGCVNRWYFVERTRDLIIAAREQNAPLSLIVLDVDEFKRVNDTHGHPVGDGVLANIGSLLHSHGGPGGLIGRMGGEEFALLTPGMTAGDASLFAEQLRQAIGGSSVDLYGATVSVTASIGVAGMRDDEEFSSLYARADAALYLAKKNGRNRFEVTD